jgi:hypothetical protein
MGSEQSVSPAAIENTKVFEYRREVMVELHARTQAGEFEVVSYTFRTDPEDETTLQHPEIPSTHEEIVTEVLDETDYTLA